MTTLIDQGLTSKSSLKWESKTYTDGEVRYKPNKHSDKYLCIQKCLEKGKNPENSGKRELKDREQNLRAIF